MISVGLHGGRCQQRRREVWGVRKGACNVFVACTAWQCRGEQEIQLLEFSKLVGCYMGDFIKKIADAFTCAVGSFRWKYIFKRLGVEWIKLRELYPRKMTSIESRGYTLTAIKTRNETTYRDPFGANLPANLANFRLHTGPISELCIVSMYCVFIFWCPLNFFYWGFGPAAVCCGVR